MTDEFEMMTWDQDDPYDDADHAEALEPQIWLLTLYPDPDDTDKPISETDIENALLLLPDVLSVELKVMS